MNTRKPQLPPGVPAPHVHPPTSWWETIVITLVIVAFLGGLGSAITGVAITLRWAVSP